MNNKLTIIGNYSNDFNKLLGLNIEFEDIYLDKEGLAIHMTKRKHLNCLQFIEDIPEIIEKPDYIGVNPNESGGETIELIKQLGDINVLIGIKTNRKQNYLYVATMYDVTSKIRQRLHSGRIKIFSKSN